MILSVDKTNKEEIFMPDKACNQQSKIKESVCIDTNRVYDSCADKDCLEDLRLTFTKEAQSVINTAASVKARCAEVLNVLIDVEKVPFNRGFYSVDLTYFFRVSLDTVQPGCAAPVQVDGLATFNKKCILYGSEGNVKVFSSTYVSDENDIQFEMANTNPKAKVQTVDPIVLDARIAHPRDICDCFKCKIPKCVCKRFIGTFADDFPQSCERAVVVTLGIFTIVQLERDVQMLIPAYDFCMPKRECSCDTEGPCDAFRRIKFPVDEFFPPKEGCLPDSYRPTGCCEAPCDS